MRNKTTRVGFWYSPYEKHLPKVEDHIRPMWKDRGKFISALRKMDAKATKTQYKGISLCRICGKRNGSADHSYRGFVWPQGLSHYVQEHNVVPDNDEFIKMILSSSRVIGSKIKTKRSRAFDFIDSYLEECYDSSTKNIANSETTREIEKQIKRIRTYMNEYINK